MVLGDHNRRLVEGTEKEIAVKQYIQHPEFNSPYPINNDIALLQLGVEAKLTSRINTVCLPPQGYAVPPITSKCYITGEEHAKLPNTVRSFWFLISSESLDIYITSKFFTVFCLRSSLIVVLPTSAACYISHTGPQLTTIGF